MFRAVLIVCFAFILSACGQGGTIDGKVSAAQARNDGPPIWAVKDKDSTLYLYGTVHLLPPDLVWQKSDMADAFASAGTVFFEVASDDAAKLRAVTLTQEIGFQPSGLRLSDSFDGYQLKLLEAAANNGAVRREAIDGMQPWLAAEFLTVTAAASAGLSPELAADEALKSRARRQKKNVMYLDSVETQIRASSGQSQAVQMRVLTEALERFNQLGDNLTSIAESWAIGDTADLRLRTVDTLAGGSPDLYAALIVNRNAAWTDEFETFLDGTGTGFAAVGIAHLLGDDSVQEMLRGRGYTVTRYYAFQGEPVIKPIKLD